MTTSRSPNPLQSPGGSKAVGKTVESPGALDQDSTRVQAPGSMTDR